MDTNYKASNQLLYVPASASDPHPHLADDLITLEDGRVIGRYTGLTKEQLSAQMKTELLVTDRDTFCKMKEDSYVTAPKPITKEQFRDALECLPPLQWVRHLGVESFRFMERYTGSITTIYARTGDQYWEFMDRYNMSSDDLAQKVIAASKAASAQGLQA